MGHANWRKMGVVLLALTLAATASAQGTRGQDEGLIHGLPAKLHSLHDLAQIKAATDLTPLQRTEVLLTWLVEEHRNPTPTKLGAAGKPVDSGYIQVQIVQNLIGGKGDAQAVWWLAHAKGLRSKFVRRAMCLTMGYNDDPAVVDSLVETALQDPNPHFRALAVQWLGGKDDPRVDPLLEIALRDTFVVRDEGSHSHLADPNTLVQFWHPVREKAEEAVRNRRAGIHKDPERAASRRTALEYFVKGYDDYAKKNKAALDRLIKIANSDRPPRRPEPQYP